MKVVDYVMIYDLKKVTGIYVKGFCDFIEKNKLGNEDMQGLYDLFSYAIKGIHGLPCSERNYFTDVYGDDCIKHLKKLRGVPKKVSKLDTNDRIAIVTMCKSYFVAILVLNDEKEKGLTVLNGCKESL